MLISTVKFGDGKNGAKIGLTPHSDPGVDTGIDLVAKTSGTDEYHAIQAKFYDADGTLYKKQVDSFFTASGKKPFVHRLLIISTDKISPHVDAALQGQHIPCQKITLAEIEQSTIDWNVSFKQKTVQQRRPKDLRDYQKTAISQVIAGLKEADRGKLIMACGTGKTLTSLRLAEQMVGTGGRVLFLVPSLALLSQTLTEWTQEAIPSKHIHSFAVCSDNDVGKSRDKNDDYQMVTHELQFPATTDAKKLAHDIALRHDSQHMSVVFSTYHSIGVISKAQKEHHLDEFDLIICDEAYRTTGAAYNGVDESAFVKVHSQDTIKGTKRIYMTATPRIYSDSAKATAEKDNVALFSMNDEAMFGKELYVITFSEAVTRGLLVDYKVIVLAVEEAHIHRRLQRLLKDDSNQLKVDDAAKIVGCWKALSKQGLAESDDDPMQRAVAFCQVIDIPKAARTHKVSSKNIANMFQAVVEAYQDSIKNDEQIEESTVTLRCEAEHVDGSMNASQKEKQLAWLKEPSPENTCRILSNVRCLSEGVDVPALDAVIFLSPKNSQVDVVQSVGRVMRNSPGKKLGYVILPVVIPAGVEPHESLNDNKTYAVVWQVLQALRSHDDRFDAFINKLDLIGKDPKKMEVIAITHQVPQKPSKDPTLKNKNAGRSSFNIGASDLLPKVDQAQLPFEIGEIERALYAKLVKKCGNRNHWEEWANDIAKIARTHIDRITAIIQEPANTIERKTFEEFANVLRNDLNDSITNNDVIEMLAQHLITQPVFEALFSDYSFAQENPMSKQMQAVLNVLQAHRLDKETDTLQKFYASVKTRAEGISDPKAKQRIVVELYEKFFKNAFRATTERLGIVYTPIEIVDFIIHSIDHILRKEFGQTLGSKGVHIIDPFVGTGNFITRLLESELITLEELPYKYKNEIHANDILLLAYYISAINIEAVYHGIVKGNYQAFEGICLTDSFHMLPGNEDWVEAVAIDNSARRRRQKTLDIRVIMGNPPYSAGQESANDNNANVVYPKLDEKIRFSYTQTSEATNKNALYDSYIRAICWASDRVGESGVIGFVTNAGFLENNAMDGLRKCLAKEFSSIYVFHLRGNQRTSGELSRKEGGKIFGSGSRAPIAISLLVKNPHAEQQGQIYFHDIGDYLNQEEKLEKIKSFKSIDGITDVKGWKKITPDVHGDWLRQRDNSFANYIALGSKSDQAAITLFNTYSSGIKTNRDAWCYNASKISVTQHMAETINFYNAEIVRFEKFFSGQKKEIREKNIRSFVNSDPTKMSWDYAQHIGVEKGREGKFNELKIVQSLYRPFTKQWLYFDRFFNNRVYQMPRIFPNAKAENLVITVNAKYFGHGQIALIANALPDLHSNGDAQCFPL